VKEMLDSLLILLLLLELDLAVNDEEEDAIFSLVDEMLTEV
jgi:hypothetical protein